MSCELKPLSWKEFDRMHRKAWNNGWVFGPAFTELYLDYLENWNWFMIYLEEVIRHSGDEKSIKLLIGEAPPIWRGTNLSEERTYFYNPNHDKGNQPWLYEPFKYYNQKYCQDEWNKNEYTGPHTEKQAKLMYLASKGVILIDVFPFPIIQDTDNRKEIDTKKEKTSFSTHVKHYLIKHLKKLLCYLKCRTENDQLAFECAFMAPEYTSLQLMYDPDITEPFTNLKLTPLNDFEVHKISDITFEKEQGVIPLENPKSESKHMSYFLYKLNKKKQKIYFNEIENIPILIADGSPNFKNFFNGNADKIKTKFSRKKK